MLPYHIKARDMNIYKPEGKVIKFWLYAESRKELDTILKKKNITEIKWILQEIPPWEK